MLGAVADIGVGGKVKHDVGAPNGGGERREIQDVPAYEREARMCSRLLEEPLLAC